MLDIDLQALEKGPLSWREEIPRENNPWSDTDLRLVRPARADLYAVYTGDHGVHLTGQLEATLRLECRRCLNEVPTDVQVELDLLFDPEREEEGAEGVYPYESNGRRLDLKPALREQLLLEVPGYPICREQCAGLCPKCGIDLNEDECDCTLREPDPRWDALRELNPETG